MTTNGNANGSIIIEAEDLNFDNDFVVSQIDSSASGGEILRVRGDRRDANATTTFNGPDGTYSLTLYSYDENDGNGRLNVWVNGQQVSATVLNRNLGVNLPSGQSQVQILVGNLRLRRGDRIEIEAVRDGGEMTSLDKIVFAPINPPVDPQPERIVIEAEDLNYDNDFVVSGIDGSASGGRILRVRSDRQDGDATTVFNGADGTYNLTLDAYDENDGRGRITVWVNGQQVSRTVLNQNLGSGLPDRDTKVQIVVNDLDLATGDLIRIESRRDRGEYTSLDKITFAPVVIAPDVEIISNGGDRTAVINIDENTTAVTDFEVNVGDDDVIYRINDGADRDLFNIDAATGVLTFKNAPDWEAPLDAGGDNVYEVNVIAVGAGSGDGQFVSVVVEDVDDTTPGGGPTETITLEAEALTLDGNFFISGKDTGASGGLIIRARPGNNTGTATTTFGGASGTYRLTLDAYDENDGVGRLNVKVNGQTVSTTVLDQDLGQAGPRAGSRRQIVVDDLVLSTNDLIEIMGVSNGGEYTSLDKLTFEPIGPADVPVEIISNGGGNTAFINVDEGTSAVTGFEVNVGDDNVLYRINAGADRDFFEIDPQTGQLSFKSAPDFQQPLDAGANNVYEVNVVAIGANSGDGQFVSVKVNDVVLPGGPDATFDVVEGIRSVADIDVSGSQAGASFRINAGADRDLFFINPETGVLSFKRSPDFENPTDRAEGNAIAGDNLYEVNVLATNGNQTESKFITVAVKDVDESTLPDPISVYLLAGQSNLVGEAQVANLTDTSYVQPFSVAQIWSRPQVDFVDLAPGFDGQMVELGPELSFGRQIVDKTGENVLLIKYGLGSTTLAEDWQKDGSGTQFNKLKDIVDVALDSLTNQGLTYDIEGLVWMQGESDTYNDAFAGAYEDNLLGFVDGVRDVYGENLDVAVGLIRNDLPTSARNRELVRDAQRVVSAGDSKVFLVDTDALGGSEVLRPGDTTHYNADGQILLGNAFADAFVG